MSKKKLVNPLGSGSYTAAPGDKGHDDGPDETELLMVTLHHLGVTPEQYKEFVEQNKAALDVFSNLAQQVGLFDGIEAELDNSGLLSGSRHKMPRQEPLADAAEKTLALKISMKGVNKPPFWREITIPANATFYDLYTTIMYVTGLERAHLWHFSESPYSSIFQITENDEDDAFDIQPPHDTFLTEYIAEKGDKIMFVYDYGDDWIFEISVKEVIDSKSKTPALTKWKSDLQPLEDTGGSYMYLQYRNLAEMKDTDKKFKQFADDYGYEKPKYLRETLDEAMIDPSEINMALSTLVINK